MSRVLWIPERSNALALKVAYAVQSGVVPCLEQYRDERRAAASAQVLAILHSDPDYRARCVVLGQRVVDDGTIWVGKVVDRSTVSLGDVAAALFLIIGGAYAVGFASVL